MRCFWTAIVSLMSLYVVEPGLGQETVKSFTFKKTKQADLAIHVHYPPDWKKEDKRPAIVFFFGGGFQFGSVSQFEPQAAYFARRGMVTARADYRVKSRHGVEPDACVDDAKSAVRWLRQNTANLGMDSNRIVASGSSSGGYLAACLACPGPEPEGEDLKISSRPNAIILFNPFLPFANQNADWKIVPTLHLTKDTPPTLIFFGTKDELLPRAAEFMAKSKEVGHKAEMYLAEGVGHGFSGKSPWREKTLQRADEFLAALGYLQGKPTIKVPDAKDAQPKPQPKPDKTYEPQKTNPIALMKMMEGFRKKLPPPQGLNEMNGMGTVDVDGEVHPDSHLWGIATRMSVRTKADCMIFLTYLKDRQVKIRHIAAFALEDVVKAYPNGFPAGSLDELDSDQHRRMVQAFVAGIEKLAK